MQSDRRPTEFRAGDTFATDYRILGELGSGGMGTVFKAEETNIGRLVAIKAVRPQLMVDKASVSRFRREASAISKLDHPCIVKAFRVGITEAGQPYTVMEYIAGTSLSDLIAQRGGLPFGLVQNIFGQILDAVGYAHEHGILHRDLKPSNIMLISQNDEYQVKIVDFGLALVLNDQEQKLTQTGQVVGTAAYLSPEQCRGERADKQSDLYAVGCMLYEALIGRQPFTGDTAIATMLLHEHGRSPEFPPNFDKRLKSIILRAICRERDGRFQSAEEFKTALLKPETFKQKKSGRQLQLSKLLPATTLLRCLAILIAGLAALFTYEYCNKAKLCTANISDVNKSLRARALKEYGPGMRAEEEGDYDTAFKRYQRMLAIDPDDQLMQAEFKHRQGMIARDRDNSKGASEYLLDSLRMFEAAHLTDTKFYVWTALDFGDVLCTEMHDPQEGRRLFKLASAAVVRCQDDDHPAILRGNTYAKIAAIDPDFKISADYFAQAATAYAGEPASSPAHEAAMKSAMESWNSCGIRRREGHDYAGAAIAFENTHAIARSLADRFREGCACLDAADMYTETGNSVKAKQSLLAAVDVFTDVNADMLSSAYCKLAALATTEPEQEKYYQLAIAPSHAPSSPAERWRRALARVDYAQWLVDHHRFTEPKPLLSEALVLTADATPQTRSYAPFARARGLYTLGRLTEQLGHIDQALEWYQKATFAGDINSAEAKRRCAEIYSKRGKKAQAATYYADAARDFRAAGNESAMNDCKTAAALLNSSTSK